MKQAQQCNEFHPSKEQLVELARFEVGLLLAHASQPVVTPQKIYIAGRLNKIMDVLGRDLLSAVIESVTCEHEEQQWRDRVEKEARRKSEIPPPLATKRGTDKFDRTDASGVTGT